MKITVGKLRRLIREAIMESGDAEASINAMFKELVKPINLLLKEHDATPDDPPLKQRRAYGLKSGTSSDFRDKVEKLFQLEEGSLNDLIQNIIERASSAVGYPGAEYDVIARGTSTTYKIRKRGDNLDDVIVQAYELLTKKKPQLEQAAEQVLVGLQEKIAAEEKSQAETDTQVSGLTAKLKKTLDPAIKSAAETLNDPELTSFFLKDKIGTVKVKGPQNSSQVSHIAKSVLRGGNKTPRDIEDALRSSFQDALKAKDDFGKKSVSIEDKAKEFVDALKQISDFGRDLKSSIDRDSKKLSKYDGAPSDAPLGRIAFATARKNKPFEVNTPVEDELMTKIISHVEGAGNLDKKSVNLIRKFVDVGIYDDIFKMSDVDVLYRGMAVPVEWFKKLKFKDPNAQNTINDMKIPKNSKSDPLDVSYIFKPDRDTSSWTSSYEIAKAFAVEQIEQESGRAAALVVLSASVPDNPDKFVDLSGVYDIVDISSYKGQKEHIGVGPIKVSQITISSTFGVSTKGEIPGYREL